jgi:hypothetical protein
LPGLGRQLELDRVRCKLRRIAQGKAGGKRHPVVSRGRDGGDVSHLVRPFVGVFIWRQRSLAER